MESALPVGSGPLAAPTWWLCGFGRAALADAAPLEREPDTSPPDDLPVHRRPTTGDRADDPCALWVSDPPRENLRTKRTSAVAVKGAVAKVGLVGRDQHAASMQTSHPTRGGRRRNPDRLGRTAHRAVWRRSCGQAARRGRGAAPRRRRTMDAPALSGPERRGVVPRLPYESANTLICVSIAWIEHGYLTPLRVPRVRRRPMPRVLVESTPR